MSLFYYQVEEKHLRETMEQSRLRLQEFEERQRRIKQEPIEANEVNKFHPSLNFDFFLITSHQKLLLCLSQ